MLTILAHGNDGLGVSAGNRGITALGVIGAVANNGNQHLIAWNLREQIRQDGRIANAVRGDFNGTDFECFHIDPQAYLARLPTIFGTMFLGFPLTLTQHLDASLHFS